MLGPAEILVVEDSCDSVKVLATALSRTFPGVPLTLAGSVRDFHAQLPRLGQIELAVVDLGLPDGFGHEIIEVVRARWPEAQILVYTLFDDDGNLFEALKRGANGYLLKYDPPSRLSEALRTIMAGEPPLSPKIALRMLREFREGGRTPPEDATGSAASARAEAAAAHAAALQQDQEDARQDSMLTPRELDTLTLAAKGLRLPELAEHLGVTRSTAATYLKRIYRKLSVNSRAEATLEAVRIGLVNVARGPDG